MRKNIISLFLLLCPVAMFAQNDFVNGKNDDKSFYVKHFEGEVLIGFTAPLGGYNGDFEIGPAFGYEFRYNIDEIPIDFGTQINYTTTGNNYSGSLAVFGDWNFGQGQKSNTFVGLGIGWAGHESHHDYCGWDSYEDDKAKTIIIPRVGVELFRHLRLTLSSNISGKGYNNLQLSVGVVFGGGLKKKLPSSCAR